MEFAIPSLVAAIDFNQLPQQLVNGILTGSIYALVALGYTMVYGVLKLINFAHGEIFMLGMFSALFASWWMGFSGTNPSAMGSPMVLLVMLLFSMTVCAVIGVTIERFAYRPMRNQPRIAALITAIGMSLLLQHGGALFLPVSPPPSIREQVNPYRDNINWWVRPRDASLLSQSQAARAELDKAQKALDERVKQEGVESEFALSNEGQAFRKAKFAAESAWRKLDGEVNNSGTVIVISQGKLIMFLITMVLMAILRFIVMNTPIGRQMRAVSHDFDSASLMGINVNRIVMITFLIGSALAGAGGMMAATFQGEALSSFSGVNYGVKAFVAAVLGGIGNIPGAVLGGILMGVAEASVTAFGFSAYKDIVAFLVLILVLLFRPGGLLGSAKVEKV